MPISHYQTACRSWPICTKCRSPEHDSKTYTNNPTYISCKGQHTAYSKYCPEWQIEKKIQYVQNSLENRKIIFFNSTTFLTPSSSFAGVSSAATSTPSNTSKQNSSKLSPQHKNLHFSSCPRVNGQSQNRSVLRPILVAW